MGSSTLLSSALLILVVLQVVQCQVDCEDYKSAETTFCSVLFQRFQSALVGSELNLYNLRKTFSPASHPAPILVNVSYEIQFGQVSDKLCPGANDSSMFNTSGLRHLNYGWTSSVFYTYYHPAELNRLQPQLVFLVLKSLEFDPEDDSSSVDTAFTWDGTGSITTAKISLFIPSLPCSPTYKEVYNTLQDITSLLKVYTEIRSNLTTWTTKNAGYVIDGSSLSTNSKDWGFKGILVSLYIACIGISFLLAIVSSCVLIYAAFYKTPNDSKSDTFTMWHSLFWTSVVVLAQFDVVLIIVDVAQIIFWCSSPTGCGPPTITKIVWYVFVFAFSCIGIGFILGLYCKVSSSVPFVAIDVGKMFFLVPTLKPPPFLSPYKSACATYIFGVILFPTLFIFLAMIYFYILPVLVLLVVYPVKVASAYSFLTAALVLYILISFYGEYKRMIKRDWNKLLMCFYMVSPHLNIMLIYIISVLFSAVYNAISDGYPRNSVLRAIVSFIPSLILTSFIWPLKNRILKWLEKKAEEEGILPRDQPLQHTTQERSSQPHTYGATVEMTEALL